MAEDTGNVADTAADETKKTADFAANQAKSGADQAANFAKDAADRMRDAGGQAQTAFQERIVEPAKRAGEALRQGGQKVAENNQQIGVKMIDQAEQNTREAFAAMRNAAQAKDLSEVMRVQGDYLREQSQRSMAQAREIGELIVSFGRDAVGAMRGEGGQRTGGE
ncbi:phasin family protein [Sphingomonas sp.]|uniref:phasin family protein n=1 Tax=Sphingomonas sp. TaxID=28214 RepID=UPI003B00B294